MAARRVGKWIVRRTFTRAGDRYWAWAYHRSGAWTLSTEPQYATAEGAIAAVKRFWKAIGLPKPWPPVQVEDPNG
jgi:hypothetical protein